MRRRAIRRWSRAGSRPSQPASRADGDRVDADRLRQRACGDDAPARAPPSRPARSRTPRRGGRPAPPKVVHWQGFPGRDGRGCDRASRRCGARSGSPPRPADRRSGPGPARRFDAARRARTRSPRRPAPPMCSSQRSERAVACASGSSLSRQSATCSAGSSTSRSSTRASKPSGSIAAGPERQSPPCPTTHDVSTWATPFGASALDESCSSRASPSSPPGASR